MSEHMLHEYKMFSVRTLICNIQKYNMSKPMLHMKIWCLLSELILHTKMHNVRTHAAQEIWCLVSKVMLHTKCVMTEHMLHTSMRLFLVQTNATYENVYCPNICYTRIWDVFCSNLGYTRKHNVLCPNLYYIRKYVMSEPMLHTKI